MFLKTGFYTYIFSHWFLFKLQLNKTTVKQYANLMSFDVAFLGTHHLQYSISMSVYFVYFMFVRVASHVCTYLSLFYLVMGWVSCTKGAAGSSYAQESGWLCFDRFAIFSMHGTNRCRMHQFSQAGGKALHAHAQYVNMMHSATCIEDLQFLRLDFESS